MDLPILQPINSIRKHNYRNWTSIYEEEIIEMFLTIKNFKDYNFLDKCNFEEFKKFCYKYSDISKSKQLGQMGS